MKKNLNKRNQHKKYFSKSSIHRSKVWSNTSCNGLFWISYNNVDDGIQYLFSSTCYVIFLLKAIMIFSPINKNNIEKLEGKSQNNGGKDFLLINFGCI